MLPLGVAAGFTGGCPRRAAEPRAALATLAPRDAPPGAAAAPAARPRRAPCRARKPEGCLPEPGEKKMENKSKPNTALGRVSPSPFPPPRPSAAGWEAAAAPPAAWRRGKSQRRARSCLGGGGEWGGGAAVGVRSQVRSLQPLPDPGKESRRRVWGEAEVQRLSGAELTL